MTTYQLKHLRAMSRIEPADLAKKLSIGIGELRTLESTPLHGWDVADVHAYLAALGYRLKITATGRNGEGVELV